jgi:hypothetical protein
VCYSSHGAGCEGSITGIAKKKKIFKKTFGRKWHYIIPRAKVLPKKEKLHPYRVCSPKVTSIGFGETCTILFMFAKFCLGTSVDSGRYMVYGLSLVSSDGYIKSQNTRV